jgi:hypothetical protein
MIKLSNKIIFFGLFFLLLIPLFIQGVEFENPIEATSVQEIIKAISDWAWDIGFALAVLMMIVGAFYLITATGDPERVNTGKKIITWTIIGIIVLFLSTQIITLIENILKGTE